MLCYSAFVSFYQIFVPSVCLFLLSVISSAYRGRRRKEELKPEAMTFHWSTPHWSMYICSWLRKRANFSSERSSSSRITARRSVLSNRRITCCRARLIILLWILCSQFESVIYRQPVKYFQTSWLYNMLLSAYKRNNNCHLKIWSF